ncbi:MAG: hypothetical protein ACE5GH_07125, partial [Fidelibacterota bacterium]
MNRTAIPFLLSFLLFGLTTLTGSEIAVRFPNEPEKRDFIKTFEPGRAVYISTKDLVRVMSARIFTNVERSKIVIYVGGHRIKVSAHSSFVVIDNRVYQMPTYALFDGTDILLPMRPFLSILRRHAVPGITYDDAKDVVLVEMIAHNITGLSIEEKANGTIIHIRTTRTFDRGTLSSWLAKNGWFYLTVRGGVADSLALRRTGPTSIVRSVSVDQVGTTAQLAFQLRSEIENHEVYQNSNPPEIVLTLRTPLTLSAEKIKKLRDSWYIDTVVI